MAYRRFYRILDKIKKYAQIMSELSDEELQYETTKLKSALKEGKSLDDILPEAYAAIAEADRRIIGKYPYDVQILGAIGLEKGYLDEMNTGEGKTLMATLPLYLNALTGKSTILVTANEYLAYRDAAEMRPVFDFMGVVEKAGVTETPGEFLTNNQKKINYSADILYTTHSVLAFDYLLNHLVMRAEDRFFPEMYFIIIDEADSVLLDGAQMPLVISGSPRVQSNLYAMTDLFVSTLKENRDYEVEDKSVWLTDRGVKYAERFFGIDGFYEHKNFELNRHVTLALRAHALFKNENDYVVSDNKEIVLLDNSTGRSLPGMKLRGGEHQAIEQKEKVALSQEQRSVASITYQNLFLMFPKMCGMSGTISDAKKELREVYHKKVMVVPTRKKIIRHDRHDKYFITADEQYERALKETLNYHKKGRPVLVVTATIMDTRIFSSMLVKHSVPHSVLNANNAYWEAEIIAAAGQKNAVTVSTGMAGRGTDIKLGDGVRELGGLAVIGIGRMENIRLEKQARGRAGRQGDPGSSCFFVSLEDEVVKAMNRKKSERILSNGRKIPYFYLKHLIDSSRNIKEEQAVSTREQSVRYDEILRRQREIFYNARDRILDKEEISRETIMKIAEDDVRTFLYKNKDNLDDALIQRFVLDNLSYEMDKTEVGVKSGKKGLDELLNRLMTYIGKLYDDKKRNLPPDIFQDYSRKCVMKALDSDWVEELDYLQQLQFAITTRGTAQRNPLFEYSREAYESFDDMKENMKKNIVRNFFLSEPETGKDGKLKIIFP
jgi:preprotein translocase subunit SecA